MVEENTLSSLTLGLLLGQEPKSKELINFFDFCLKLLVDHGPQVSGAVNTMITARAGRDLASSLASGILTIGSRFGGAINQSAQNWLNAVSDKEAPADFVERFARSGQYVPGIGHKKYRSDSPDPRVTALIKKYNVDGPYLKFARQVEAITLSKKAQLILNVDGAIAAIALDILQTKEKLTVGEIQTLIDCEFFNAIFILARSIGFTAHFMEQKRLDEGLFRLPDELISSL
jgi:ATP citrate (pro-S)-lyase